MYFILHHPKVTIPCCCNGTISVLKRIIEQKPVMNNRFHTNRIIKPSLFSLPVCCWYNQLLHIMQRSCVMIVSIGEALIDFIYQQEGDLPLFRPVPGGSPMNTSIALSRLAVPAAFLGCVSADLFGDMLREHLKTNGVVLTGVIPSNNPTTLAFAKIVGKAAEYAFFSNGSADRSITAAAMERAAASLPEAPKCWQIGSISLLLEPGASEIETFIERTAETAVISFDPNIRAGLVEDEHPYRMRLQRLFTLSDIVKISDEDLEWVFPGTPLEEAAQNILESGPSVCVVTAGKKGAHLFSTGLHRFLEAREIKVTDTIGAGDTFHAGLLAYFHDAGLLEKKALSRLGREDADSALRYAAAAAEITCSRAGADPPTKDELALELKNL
jgi:fructokinase